MLKSIKWLLLLFIVAITVWGNLRPDDPPDSPLMAGTFRDYSYHYTREKESTAVVFSPHLPVNDAIVVEAMRAMVVAIYGDTSMERTEPQITHQNGVNLLALSGHGVNYLFLVIKSQDGAVMGFKIWQK